MTIVVCWSSGKDSAWMLHALQRRPDVTITALLTTFNEAVDRVAMHAVRRTLVERQAEAAGLPLWRVDIPSPCTNEIYDERMGAAVTAARDAGVTHIAFGDLFLEDIRRYREARLTSTGITPIFPLWGRPTPALAGEMIAGGLEAMLTCVDPRVLDERFAGRSFDAALLEDLPPGVDPCGENGEFHSFCHAGPMFTASIPIHRGEIVHRDGFVFADVREIGPVA